MAIRWGRRRSRGGARCETRRPSPAARVHGERGFSILETTIALGVIFTVMLGLFAALDSGVRGLLTGRQRTGATAVAKEVVERARSVPYDDVGHDLEHDPTLADDPAITGIAPDLFYQPDGVDAPEQLVAAVDPQFPLHQWTQERDGSSFHVTVYVTWNDELVGDKRKRLTVEVVHTPALYDPSTVENAVRLSTFLTSGAGVPCVADCLSVAADQASGLVTVNNGGIVVSGTIPGTNFAGTEIRLPTATGSFTANSRPDGSSLKREANGVARGALATMEMTSGTPGTAGACASAGSTATCAPVVAATAVDNDGGSPDPAHQVDGPSWAAMGSLSSSPITTSLSASTGSVVSKSTIDSCVTCTPVVGDGDRLPYTESVASGVDTGTISFLNLGILGGHLASVSGGSASALIDDDPVADDQLITSEARLQAGAVSLFGLSTAGLQLPVGFTSAASISAVDVTARAQVGPGAASPTVTGPSIAIQVWDTLALGVQGYRTVNVAAGASVSSTANASFNVLNLSTGLLNTVTLETTVSSGPKQTTCDTNCAGSAEARLQNWLNVSVRVTVVASGVTQADLTIDVSYGSLSAVAAYKEV